MDPAGQQAEEVRVIRPATNSVLVEAIALYRKHGFVPYHPPHLSARCDLAFERRL